MCTAVPQPLPSPPRIYAHIRGQHWSAKIDDISLWPSEPTKTNNILYAFGPLLSSYVYIQRVPIERYTYRGPDFLAVGWSGSSPIPTLLSLERRHTGRLRKWDNLLTGKSGWGIDGIAESFYDSYVKYLISKNREFISTKYFSMFQFVTVLTVSR